MAILCPQDKPISRKGQFANKKGWSHSVWEMARFWHLSSFWFPSQPCSTLCVCLSHLLSLPSPSHLFSSLLFLFLLLSFLSSSLSLCPLPAPPAFLLSSSCSLSSFFPPSSLPLPPLPCFTDLLSKSTCSCSSLLHVLSARKPPFSSSQFQIPPQNWLTQPLCYLPKDVVWPRKSSIPCKHGCRAHSPYRQAWTESPQIPVCLEGSSMPLVKT